MQAQWFGVNVALAELRRSGNSGVLSPYRSGPGLIHHTLQSTILLSKQGNKEETGN